MNIYTTENAVMVFHVASKHYHLMYVANGIHGPFTQVLLSVLIMFIHYYYFKGNWHHTGHDNCIGVVYICLL